MTKEMEKLFLRQLQAEDARNRKILPSGIVYQNGMRESAFSKEQSKKKKG